MKDEERVLEALKMAYKVISEVDGYVYQRVFKMDQIEEAIRTIEPEWDHWSLHRTGR